MDAITQEHQSTPAGVSPRIWTVLLPLWLRMRHSLRGPWLAVLTIWALCWGVMALWVEQHSLPLPNCDEYCFVSVAAGQEPSTLRFIFTPQNEHRQPLTRLQLCVAGWLSDWNFRHILQINLALLAFAALLLLLAARTIRGQATLSDAFLCLIIFHPYAYRTIVCYAYAQTLTLAIFCVALAMLASGWAMRSMFNLCCYFTTAVAVSLAGGPLGQCWSLGLCGILPILWIQRKPLSWKLCGLIGTAMVGLVALIFVCYTPHVAVHDSLRNPEPFNLLIVSLKQSIAWVGRPLVELTWPWMLVALLLPWTYILCRSGFDCFSLRSRNPETWKRITAWADLAVVLLACLGVVILIGYARGPICLWSSRYHFIIAPLAIVTYLLLLRIHAWNGLPGLLMILIAVSCGCSWPYALRATADRNKRGMEMVRTLRSGTTPLSLAAERYCDVTWAKPWGINNLIHYWNGLRDARASDFRRMSHAFTPRSSPASSLHLQSHMQLVDDPKAVSHLALQVVPAGRAQGQAQFSFDLPRATWGQIWVRTKTSAPGQTIGFRVDNNVHLTIPMPHHKEYTPMLLIPCLHWAPGRHRLEITLADPGSRIDFIEFVPQPQANK